MQTTYLYLMKKVKPHLPETALLVAVLRFKLSWYLKNGISQPENPYISPIYIQEYKSINESAAENRNPNLTSL